MGRLPRRDGVGDVAGPERPRAETEVGGAEAPVGGGPGDVSDALDDGWHRHPSDVARAVASLVVALVLLVLESVKAPLLRRWAGDVLGLFDLVPTGVSAFLIGVLQLLATVAPVVAVAALALRRDWRLLARLTGAAVLGSTVMAWLSSFLADSLIRSVEANQDLPSWFAGAAYPSGSYLAGLTAVLTAAAPAISRPWRRAAWAAVAVVALVRLITATTDPLTVALLVALGSCAGSAVLVAVGARRRRVDPAVVAETLRRNGIEPVTIEVVRAGGPTPTFRVLGADGRTVWVTVLGRDQRDTDLLLQIVRWLRVRGLGDVRPPGVPRRVAERAALAGSLALAGGVRVAGPRTVARTTEGAVALVVDHVTGPDLTTVSGAVLSDGSLADLWRQVDLLHRAGLAHRGLTGRRIIFGPDGPTLVHFRAAELDASERVRDADLVEVLVGTALRVGPGEAVTVALSELGRERLVRALPLLQPIVLQPETRDALSAHPDLLDELRATAVDATGGEQVELADLARIDAKSVVSLLGITVVGYYIVSLASDASAIWDSFRQADLGFLPWIVVLTVLQFVAGAISLHGSVNERLSLLRTTEVMFAQSLLNRFTPANAGGMALRTRYLQRSGIDLPVAVSAIGLTSVASGIAQVAVFVLFVVWGDSIVAFDDLSLPSASRVLVVVVVVGALAGVVLGSAWGRRRIRPWIARSAASAWDNLRDLCRQPSKLGMLLGGAAMSKLVSMGAFAVSIRALGVSLPLATVGALYLLATAVGGAVPTPGGVGGIEAALAAALTTVGVEAAAAASIVLLFRLINFWLPVVPGFVCLRRVQAQGIA